MAIIRRTKSHKQYLCSGPCNILRNMTTAEKPRWQEPWFEELIESYKADPASVYHTWFIDAERIKYFGAIRRGVQKVVADIKTGRFPNELKGSSLEVVVQAISEQKQVFHGADHAWVWKPKLRIPESADSPSPQLP